MTLPCSVFLTCPASKGSIIPCSCALRRIHNSFALARTVEFFRIPRDVLTICLGKSTYARCGIIVNVTPLEPEWEGHVTLEFSNTTPLPAKIYANEGVAQMLFFGGGT
jgi:dCTP deaminase